MRNNLIAAAALTVFIFTPATTLAHSGRTDSSGGHNCSASSISKGLCSGYHYHNGGPAVYPESQQVTPPVAIPTAAPTVKPTTQPTIRPTVKPSPTLSPTPSTTLTPTSSPSPSPKLSPTPSPSLEGKANQNQTKKPGGFFSWLFSLFNR